MSSLYASLSREEESEDSEIDAAEIAKLVQDVDDLDSALFGKPKPPTRLKSRVNFEDIDDLFLPKDNKVAKKFSHGDTKPDKASGLTDHEKLSINHGSSADWLGLGPEKPRRNVVKFAGDDNIVPDTTASKTELSRSRDASKSKPDPLNVDSEIIFGNYAPTISREPRRRKIAAHLIDPLGLFSVPESNPSPPVVLHQEASRSTAQQEQSIIFAQQEATRAHQEQVAIVAQQEANRVQQERANIAAQQEANRVQQVQASIVAQQEANRVQQASIVAQQEASRAQQERTRTLELYVSSMRSESGESLERSALPPWLSGPSCESLAQTVSQASSGSSPLAALTNQELSVLANVPVLGSDIAQQVQQLVAQQHNSVLRDSRAQLETELRSALTQITEQITQSQQAAAELSTRTRLSEELAACEERHQRELAWMQKEFTFREEQLEYKIARVETESRATEELCRAKICAMQDEMKTSEETHRRRLADLRAEHVADIQQLREFHRTNLEDWRSHQMALLGGNGETQVAQMNASQQMLANQRDWSTAERDRLVAQVAALEAQINEQRQRNHDTQRKETQVSAMQRERLNLQAEREALAEEARETADKLEQQRLAIAGEKARLATLTRLYGDTDVARMKAEVSAALQVAQSAERDNIVDRSKIRAEQSFLEAEQARLKQVERQLENKAWELHEMTQMAVKAREEGLRALAEATLRDERVKQQLELVKDRERKCVEQKVNLSEERVKLRSKASLDFCSSPRSESRFQNLLDPKLLLLQLRADRMDFLREEQHSYYSVSK